MYKAVTTSQPALLGQLLRVDLITLEGSEMSVNRSVRPYVRPSVRPSVHKKFSDFNAVWYVDRSRWLMHSGMLYDPIQGQGHAAFVVAKIALFYICFLRHVQGQLANDHWHLNYSTISKFDQAGFLLFVLVFV